MLTCARPGCGRPRTEHSATAPHPYEDVSICASYVPAWPCGACETDCELHEKDAPHPRPEVDCEAAIPPEGFEPGGGGYGGGGATGGW